ncbi:replication endonuclease [Pseudomonas monteilii]|uniref:replication endonuclease n=1 Tax=Pseudomonas monteilii TaxID=76759 RepID=UPI003CFCA07C
MSNFPHRPELFDEHIYEDPTLQQPLLLKFCSPDRISGIAKTLSRINSTIIAEIDLNVAIGVATYAEGERAKIDFLRNLSVFEQLESKRYIDFGKNTEGSLKRACDYRSLKKQLIKLANEERINSEAVSRRVGGCTGINYCSDQTLKFRERQREISQETLEKIFVRKVGTDQVTTLAQISSGQEKRRFNQLFHISKNLQSMADDLGFQGYFVTFTAPGNYHPNPSNGRCSYDQQRLRGAHEYIQERWRLIRARLSKLKLPLSIESFFGMRFVEVHKDGCAHWHLLIFTTPERFAIFQNLADEFFPASRQWDYKAVDRERGEATSYLFKYLAKAVDSSKFHDARLEKNAGDVERLENDQSSLAHTDRVNAALRSQRIRQYQCFGMSNSITKYRIINKIEESLNDFESESVRNTLSACRMYNNGKVDKESRNLIGFKNLLTRHSDSFELLREPYLNRFGEPVTRITGVLFKCGYVYYLPQYEMSQNLDALIGLEEIIYSSYPCITDDRELDQLERDTFLEELSSGCDPELDELFKELDAVTVIYSDPRPTASQLIDFIKHQQPKRFFVKYTDIQTKTEARPPLSAHEIIELLTT